MCANFLPLSPALLRRHFGVAPPASYPAEAWPGYRAPIVRAGGSGGWKCRLARFGLIPHWARDGAIGRKTYNARSETVGERPSFKHAWRRGQYCLVPMAAFFEPSWESGKAERWRIAPADAEYLAVAGLWERWTNPQTRQPELSFTLLTVNADAHSLMRRFHRPRSEKRMIVVIPPEERAAWLHATADYARSFLLPYPAERLAAAPSPRQPVAD